MEITYQSLREKLFKALDAELGVDFSLSIEATSLQTHRVEALTKLLSVLNVGEELMLKRLDEASKT